MKKQHGQSMTEFLVVMPAMLLLIFGAIQFVLIYQAKTTLNYATFEAVRAGTLHNASRDAIDKGFIRGMAPLFARFAVTRDEAGGNGYKALAKKVLQARDLVQAEIEQGFVKVEMLNPTPNMFNAFDDKVIPNDLLTYRPTKNGINLQEANLLKLRITYCVKLIVPIVSQIISKAAGEGCAGKEPRLPIVAQALMRMQSPAIACAGSNCFDN